MTEEEAKKVLRQTGPLGNIVEHIEALHVAVRNRYLGGNLASWEHI